MEGKKYVGRYLLEIRLLHKGSIISNSDLYRQPLGVEEDIISIILSEAFRLATYWCVLRDYFRSQVIKK